MKLVSKLWAYHNTVLLLASFIALYFFARTEAAQAVIQFVGELGYFGAGVAGFLFVSTFTVVPGAILLFDLAGQLNPFLLALSAGAGGAVGDFILFRFLKDRVFEELAPLAEKFGGSQIRLLLHTPYFAWFAPVLGTLIIVSPFPDEPGIGLLGFSNMTTLQFIGLTFILDTIGVLAIVLIAQGTG